MELFAANNRLKYAEKKKLDRTKKRTKFILINSSITIDISIMKHSSSRIILFTSSSNIWCTYSNIRTNTICMTCACSRTWSIFFIFYWVCCETGKSNIETDLICEGFSCTTWNLVMKKFDKIQWDFILEIIQNKTLNGYFDLHFVLSCLLDCLRSSFFTLNGYSY